MVYGSPQMACFWSGSMDRTRLLEHPDWEKDGVPTQPPPAFSSSSLAPSSSSGTRISPAVLFIIVILAVLFFISGILHLLVRFLVKQPSSSSSMQSYPEISESDALQRQLQQLFHLHDSGLEQTFIDALPVFHFKEILGSKQQFDCAVCLCEFSEKDKLRLLPACGHAFHINCIDTWLLSNSTCPLCRGALFSPEFPTYNPVFDLDDSREEEGFHSGRESGTSTQKDVETQESRGEKGVLPVRLGKFRKMNGEEGEPAGETSSSSLGTRRCYSMGSYQYVVPDANLRVSMDGIRNARDAKLAKGIDDSRTSPVDGDAAEGRRKSNFVSKGDSFSVSKIWLWPKDRFGSNSDSQNVGLPMDEEQRARGTKQKSLARS